MTSLLFLFGFVLFSFSDAQQVGVNTPLGTVSGFHVDYGNDTSQLYFGAADVFLGIPYAEAPTGNLRYTLPKPLFQYPGRFVDASKYGSACPQPADGCLGLPTSEDCLYLNVFTPSTTVPNKYPVMVWIHGGAFITGCAPKYPYKGAIRNLVSRGVVVVTLQYRLGVPGFFTTKTKDFPANRGLYDQLEALTWVTKNIAYFGGNPKQITLFGQSSGSISVSAHTYSPLSQNLFQQAIQESNGVLTAFDGALNYSPLNQQRAQQLCNFTSDQWNAGNFSVLKPCMLAKKPEDWIPLEADNDFGWPIMVDKQFFPDLPRNLKRPEIPTIVGNMRDEWSSVWYGMLGGGMPFEAFNKDLIDGFLGEVGTFWGDNQQEIMQLIEAAYRLENSSDTDSAAWFRSGSDIFTALMYTQFVLQDVGDRLTKGNKNVFFYEQDYSSILLYNVDISSQLNGYKPVPHSSELPYIWMMDQIWDNAITNNMLKDADYELLEFYGSSWTNFAKTGKPTLDNSWTAATDRKNITYFVIDTKANGGMTMNRGFRTRDDNVFNQLITSIAGVRPPHA